MFSPDWEAFRQAIAVFIVALPFMFGVLALFTLITMGLSSLKEPKKGS